MKAAFIEATGPPENIRYGELADPVPNSSQVLVKVAAVALNPVDTYIRAGANWWDLPLPFVVGCDVAGEVVEVGSEVSQFAIGDRVWGSNQGLLGRQGTFAELCAIDPCWLYATPDGVDDKDAVACALVGVTAHLGLFRDAQLQAGETVFVQGGAGGVGSMVIQMARAAGARVIATAGSDEKVAACRALGAEAAINYRTENITTAVEQFAPLGIDLYWETSQEPDFATIVSLMAERGRIVLMAGRDTTPPFPVGPFYVKGCSLHGFVMFQATAEEQRKCSEDINRWLIDGDLAPRIDRVLPLSETAAAHRLQEENTVGGAGTQSGKIVLLP